MKPSFFNHYFTQNSQDENAKFDDDDDDAASKSRRYAFLAVVLATLALVTSSIFLPVAFGMLQRLNSKTQLELGFCRSKTRDLHQFFSGKVAHSAYTTEREKREWLFGQWVVQKKDAPYQVHQSALAASQPLSELFAYFYYRDKYRKYYIKWHIQNSESV